MGFIAAASSTMEGPSSGPQPERMLSPIMAKCPWSTTVIAERQLLSGVVNSTHSMSVSLNLSRVAPKDLLNSFISQSYLERLQQYEDCLLASREPTFIQLRNLLQVQLDENAPRLTISPNHLVDGNYRGWNQLLSAVSTYRLADIIAHVSGAQGAPPIAKKSLERQKPLEVCTFFASDARCSSLLALVPPAGLGQASPKLQGSRVSGETHSHGCWP
jgi:hypothetical protein